MINKNDKSLKQEVIVKYNLQKYQLSKISKFSLGVLGLLTCISLAFNNDIEATATINAILMLLIFRNLNKECLPKTKPNRVQLGCTYVVLMLITTAMGYLTLELKEVISNHPVAIALGFTLTLMIYNKLLPKILMFYYSIKTVLACCEECEN